MNEKRYVNVANIQDLFDEAYIKSLNGSDEYGTFMDSTAYGINLCDLVIADLPTADVKEVAHGYWIMDDDDILGMSFDCSICGYEQEESMHLNFCPYCGADMRKGEWAK